MADESLPGNLSIILSLLAMAAMVSTASFFRSHAERRQEFATMLALGYSRAALAAVQATAGSVAGLLAGFAGIAISLEGRTLFTQSYAQAHEIPLVVNHTDSAILGLMLLSAVLIGALASLSSFLWITGTKVTRLLRSSPPPVTRGGIPGFARRLPGTTLAYSLRNLFRKPLITSTSLPQH
jgi:ABC-type lipoprotein release transport system permease subunit